MRDRAPLYRPRTALVLVLWRSFFAAPEHCDMGVPPVHSRRSRAGRPCHNEEFEDEHERKSGSPLPVGYPVYTAPFDGSRVTSVGGSSEPFGGCLSIFWQAEAILETPGVKEHAGRIPFFCTLLKQIRGYFRTSLNT